MLRDPRFLDRVRRWHAELLWPSLGGFVLNIGGFLAVSPEGAQLSTANINPERLIPLLDGTRDRDAVLDRLVQLGVVGELQIHRDNQRLTDPVAIRAALSSALDQALERYATACLYKA